MDENLEQLQLQAQENLEILQMFPWLTLVIFTLPLIFVARKKVYPSLFYVLCLFVPTLATIGIIYSPDLLLLAIIVDLVIFIAAGIDLFTIPSARSLSR